MQVSRLIIVSSSFGEAILYIKDSVLSERTLHCEEVTNIYTNEKPFR